MVKTNIDDLKMELKDASLVLGTNRVVKQLREGNFSKVYIASNVPSNIEDDIAYNAEITETEVEKLNIPNDELGMVFKRPHSVLAVGVVKE